MHLKLRLSGSRPLSPGTTFKDPVLIPEGVRTLRHLLHRLDRAGQPRGVTEQPADGGASRVDGAVPSLHVPEAAVRNSSARVLRTWPRSRFRLVCYSCHFRRRLSRQIVDDLFIFRPGNSKAICAPTAATVAAVACLHLHSAYQVVAPDEEALPEGLRVYCTGIGHCQGPYNCLMIANRLWSPHKINGPVRCKNRPCGKSC